MPITPEYADHTLGAMQNMATGDFTNFLFNPTELELAINANYTALRTQGGTHDWLQYDSTGDVTTTLTLEWSLMAYAEAQRGGELVISRADQASVVEQFNDERNFFIELMYPVGEPNEPLFRAPPTVLMMWPAHVSMEFIVRNLRLRDTAYDAERNPTNYQVQLQLEEYRTWRLTSAQARRIGFKRTKPLV